MVMEFTGVHEHIVAWGNVHWSTIGVGHGDPGTGGIMINTLVDKSINFLG